MTPTIASQLHAIVEPAAIRRLDPSGWYKPLDVGEAGVAASIDDAGRILVLTAPHPVHGQVQLTAAEELPDTLRRDQTAIRRFRADLSAHGAPSFGLSPSSRAGAVRPCWLWHEAIPLSSAPGGLGTASEAPGLISLVPHPDDHVGGSQALVQVRMDGAVEETGRRWSGRIRLGRAPYPELTEGGPLASTELEPVHATSDRGVVLGDRRLGVAAAIGGDLDLRGARTSLDLVDGWFHVDLPVRRDWRSVVIGLGSDDSEAQAAVEAVVDLGPTALLRRAGQRWSRRWQGWPSEGPMAMLARRGLAYVLAACVVPIGEAACLITDHRLLPLAWTRDGYYVAKALLDWGHHSASPEPFTSVRRHLSWLFETAERAGGIWARAHLIGGQRKDQAYQADQQLYPLLELAEYVIETGDPAPLRAFERHIPSVLAAMDARSDSTTGLWSTDETPADEPALGTYPVSTQILGWRTLTRLAELGVGGSEAASRAKDIRAAVLRHLTFDDGTERILAYAVDARGRPSFDHDANDVPLAMAAEWGFFSPSDRVWIDTMRRVLGPWQRGYASGPLGGLGSVHSPGAWPLGQLQADIAGRTASDRRLREARTRALRALGAEAQWDGLLPEASDARTGEPTSRPWFAWPGALLASRHLHDPPSGRPHESASE